MLCHQQVPTNLCLDIQPPANAHPDSGDISVYESCGQERPVCSLLYKPFLFLTGTLCQKEREEDLELADSLL